MGTLLRKSEELMKSFTLSSGVVLEDPVVAYAEYGLADGPVALVCHGGFSPYEAAGPSGYWKGLIGPGKAIDTDRFRVLCPNALGAMFGTTSPLSVNPSTGKPYGGDFPPFTFEDSTRFLKAWLDSMGVTRVELAAGMSMGSCHCLMLAALYPSLVGKVVAVATAGRAPVAALTIHNLLIELLRLHPGELGVKTIFLISRLYYNHERGIQKKCGYDSSRVRDFLWEGLESRLETWDPSSIIAVLQALNTYDLGDRVVSCPTLLINFTTDQEFAPLWAEQLAARLPAARCEILDSDWGHLGCLAETAAMAPLIAEFVRSSPTSL